MNETNLTRNQLDKLNRLYLILQGYGLLTAENHLCCSTCCCADLEPKAEITGQIGYVYSHHQDWDYIREDMTLRYVGLKSNFSTHIVGQLIRIAAIAVGLAVVWDGSPNNVILVS